MYENNYTFTCFNKLSPIWKTAAFVFDYLHAMLFMYEFYLGNKLWKISTGKKKKKKLQTWQKLWNQTEEINKMANVEFAELCDKVY